jgi:hypothetical protein
MKRPHPDNSNSGKITKTTNNKYKYSPLNDLKLPKVNTYAVIADISAAYFHGEKWLINIKLIDESINPSSNGQTYVKATFFAPTLKQLPTPDQICVARFHRLYPVKHESQIQLNGNYGVTSWAFFNLFKGYLPTEHSGKTFTWTEKDIEILDKFRVFAEKLANTFCPMSVSGLDSEYQENDLMVSYVAHKSLNARTDSVTFANGDTSYEINLHPSSFTLRFKPTKGDVFRIRALFFKEGKHVPSKFTAIIKIPARFKCASTLGKTKDKMVVKDLLIHRSDVNNMVKKIDHADVFCNICGNRMPLTSLGRHFDRKHKIKDGSDWIVPENKKAKKVRDESEQSSKVTSASKSPFMPKY